MKYVNDRVRRQDRLMDEQRALELLRDGEYGVLSMVADDAGYGIPVNFVWDGDHSVYIHCAPEGRKLQAIEKNPKVSLCIIGNVNLLPRNFTTEYESAIFFGEHASICRTKRRCMHCICSLISCQPTSKRLVISMLIRASTASKSSE